MKTTVNKLAYTKHSAGLAVISNYTEFLITQYQIKGLLYQDLAT
jgi:hypothetical protein